MSEPADDDRWERWIAATGHPLPRILVDGVELQADEWSTLHIEASGPPIIQYMRFVELPAGLFHRTDVMVRGRDGRLTCTETRFVNARDMRL